MTIHEGGGYEGGVGQTSAHLGRDRPRRRSRRVQLDELDLAPATQRARLGNVVDPGGDAAELVAVVLPMNEMRLYVPLDVVADRLEQIVAARRERRRVNRILAAHEDEDGGLADGAPPVTRHSDGLDEAAAEAEQASQRAAVADGSMEGDGASLRGAAQHDAADVAAEQLRLPVEDRVHAARLRLEVGLLDDVVLEAAVAPRVVVVPRRHVRLRP
mmetsp:Transcript_21533/g.63693  ORF Transcript_21533/g.63693 Transcript_21533/m.63693 type:complete len:215 (-) Transcript_21533:487-1131(-)